MADYFACDKSRMRSVASTDNYCSKCAALRRMLSFIFAARYKPVEGTVRWSRHGAASRYTGCLRDYGARRDPGPNVIPKRDRIAAPLRVRNRETDTSRIPRSRHHPRFMAVRANLCAPRETCMAPASPPTACNRVGPNLANLTDGPVRFDRRSIIVKSTPYLPSPLVGFTRLRVAGACGSSTMIGRSIDRSFVSWIGDRIVRRILSCPLLHMKLITKSCSSMNVFQQTLSRLQFSILINTHVKKLILEKRHLIQTFD